MDEHRLYSLLGRTSRRIRSLEQVVSIVKDAVDDDRVAEMLIFDDVTSRQIEIDLRGSKEAVLQRLASYPDSQEGIPETDRMLPDGWVARSWALSREVTLLPRHWDWLKSQPGGASVTLRKFVGEARHDRANSTKAREAQESVYRFMTAMSGNFPQ